MIKDTLNRIPIGKCYDCGGIVSIPKIWMGTNRPPQECESCGKCAEEFPNLPTVPMQPKRG